MTFPSPLRDHLAAIPQRSRPTELDGAVRPGAATGDQANAPDAEFIEYALDEGPAVEILGSAGSIEAEYAAIRRGAALLDGPHHATLRIEGADRLDVLNNILTNKVADLAPGHLRQAFLLHRTGRIIADLTLIAMEDHLLADVDVHQAGAARDVLDSYVFAEDVAITDVTAAHHHVEIHGPLAVDVLRTVADGAPDHLDEHRAAEITIDGTSVVAARLDTLGVPGIILVVPIDRVAGVWEFLEQSDECLAESQRRVRPIGWFAANIARIEAGTPRMNIDYGTTSLPHETSLIESRVSFTKGCYPGQEIVVRMNDRGKPKQQLVGLRIDSDHLPVAGAQIFAKPDGDVALGDPIGAVTSSTLSPMLGATPIAFAMVRTAYTELGSSVRVNAEGEQVSATIAPLRFLPEHETAGS